MCTWVHARTHGCSLPHSLLSFSLSQSFVSWVARNTLRSQCFCYVTVVKKLVLDRWTISVVSNSSRPPRLAFRLVVISIWLNEHLTVGGKPCPIDHMLSTATGKTSCVTEQHPSASIKSIKMFGHIIEVTDSYTLRQLLLSIDRVIHAPLHSLMIA